MTPKVAIEALRMGVDVYFGMDSENKVKGAVGTTKSDGAQLSHLWVARKVTQAGLVSAHKNELEAAIKAWERVKFKAAAEIRLEDGLPKRVAVKCPYDR